MKKIIMLMLCVMFVTACQNNNQKNTKKQIDDSLGDVSDNITQQITLDFGTADVAQGKSGIYQLEYGGKTKGAIIEYVDFETKNKVALCSRAECLHNDDSCTAYIGDATASIFSNIEKDKLFIISKVFKEQEYYQKISTMDYNGENRHDIYKFKANQETKIPNIIVQNKDTLYFIIEEITDIETQKIDRFLVGLNYNTKECFTLKEFDRETRIIGGFNNKIVLEESASLLEIGNIKKDPTTTIFTVDLQDKTAKDIHSYTLELANENESLNSYLTNSNFLFEISNADGVVINKMDMLTGEKNVVYQNKNVKSKYSFSSYGIFDDKIIVGYIDENQENKRVAIDIKTGIDYPFLLEIQGEDKRKAFVTILSIYKNHYYVSVNSKIDEFEYLTKQGTYEKGRMTKLEKAFIDKEDYFNNKADYIFAQ